MSFPKKCLKVYPFLGELSIKLISFQELHCLIGHPVKAIPKTKEIQKQVEDLMQKGWVKEVHVQF